MLCFCSCANIVSPTGGPRDETAPKILNRNPVDSMLGFKGGTLVIEFDEFIKLDKIQSEFQITPLTKETPKISTKKKMLQIELPDSLLEKNTTYKLQFGKAVRDIREGNVYENLSLTFSTGNYFDSLSIKGKVWEAESGGLDTASWVVLYKAEVEDSSIKTTRPLYAVKTQSGSFSIEGLPNKDFKIFAFSNSDGDLKYNSLGERIAFLDSAVRGGSSSGLLELYSFIEADNIDTSQEGSKSRKGLASAGSFYTSNLSTKEGKNLHDINQDLELRFLDSIFNFRKEKIRFYEGEILDASSDVELDSARNISIKKSWAFDAEYKLILLTGYGQDSSGVKLKGDTLSFKTMKEADYGAVKLVVEQDLLKPSSKIYLMKRDEIIQEAVLSDSTHTFSMLLPATYSLRMLYDENANGVWDTGNFSEGKQAERMLQYPGKVLIKPNWEHNANWKKGGKKRGFD